MEWEKKKKAFVREKNSKWIQARIGGWPEVGVNTALVMISGRGQTLKGLENREASLTRCYRKQTEVKCCMQKIDMSKPMD